MMDKGREEQGKVDAVLILGERVAEYACRYIRYREDKGEGAKEAVDSLAELERVAWALMSVRGF